MEAPHRSIEPADSRENFLIDLLDALWARYRSRVPYARAYEELLARHGATFRNDHIAFRTIAWQKPASGIFSVSRLFEALGYAPAGAYDFPDKSLGAVHFRHRNRLFPKLFVSELRAWELPPDARQIVARTLATHRPALDEATLAALAEGPDGPRRGNLLEIALRFFAELPWELPQRADVEAMNGRSQYGAWALIHGHDVNHFTASIDAHGVEALSDIEKTVAAMKAAGIPMKAEIEGARGTRLRQSSTEAVEIEVAVREGEKKATMPWSYAYFELAERPLLPDPETGRPERFDGFFGPQAAQLFEMTRRKSQ